MSARSVVVVTAGLSQPSSTRLLADRLAGATVDALAARGVEAEVTVVELREHAHALVDHLLTGFPSPGLAQAIDAVETADAVIAVTPVFSGSYSGLFKTFFDVVDKDVLAGRPVLLGATAGTARHSLVLEHAMRPLFAYLHAAPVPTAVLAASEDWSSAEGEATLGSRVTRAAGELADAMTTRDPVARVDPFAVPDGFTALLANG